MDNERHVLPILFASDIKVAGDDHSVLRDISALYIGRSPAQLAETGPNRICFTPLGQDVISPWA